MNTIAKVAIGVGVLGASALALAACAPKEQDADSFGLDKFRDFDRNPQDNAWSEREATRTTSRNHTQEVNTYRVGDYVIGTRQILKTTTTQSMERIFNAAKGNDAVLSLQELRDFTLTNFDADSNGTLNRSERKKFSSQFDPTTRSHTAVIGSESFSRYSPSSYVPDYGLPGGGTGGGTSPGDDGGWNPGLPGGGTGGGTSPGDDGGYVPPSNGGGGRTSPGDGGGTTRPPAGNNGNSSNNGNPSDGDF